MRERKGLITEMYKYEIEKLPKRAKEIESSNA